MADVDLSFELTHWYQTENGKELRARITAVLPDILDQLPGTQHMQVDIGDHWPCLYRHGVVLDFHELFGGSQSKTELLKNSQDSVLLLHVLDASQDPHRILHIVDKLVAQSGHLIIVGFNPMSFWGIVRLPMLLMRKSPWRSRFYSFKRIQDWLRVLNYEVRFNTSIVHLPPLPSRKWHRRFSYIDKVFRWFIPHSGAVSVIVAKRPMYPMTMIRQTSRSPMLSPVAEPSISSSTKQQKNYGEVS